jgi:glutaminyl-tRNA synthetase
VNGWNDPRMPTISGLRRRGYTPESIRDFCNRIGVAKKENVIDVAQLEHSVREDLNRRAPRVMTVLRPLKVVLTNYPEGQVEEVDVINNPEDASAGTRKVPFSRELYIEREDFMENPPKKFFRLSPGKEVRLRCAYFITCTEVVKNEHGDVVELRCTYDPATRGGDAPDGRRVKATLHWVSAAHAVRERARRKDISRFPESALPRGLARRAGRALARGRRGGHARAVRAPRLFLRGQRFAAKLARVQPHGVAARLVGEDLATTEVGPAWRLECA